VLSVLDGVRFLNDGLPHHQACNALSSLVQTLQHEGMRGLFKGMGAPLATVALFNAVLFATRGQMEILLKHEDGK